GVLLYVDGMTGEEQHDAVLSPRSAQELGDRLFDIALEGCDRRRGGALALATELIVVPSVGQLGHLHARQIHGRIFHEELEHARAAAGVAAAFAHELGVIRRGAVLQRVGVQIIANADEESAAWKRAVFWWRIDLLVCRALIRAHLIRAHLIRARL